jgi:hypothetical protein
LHVGRVAGVLFVVALLLGCYLLRSLDAMCLTRIVLTVGWWLSFCDKRPAHTGSELVTNPRRLLGIVLVVVGTVGQFYAIRFVRPI